MTVFRSNVFVVHSGVCTKGNVFNIGVYTDFEPTNHAEMDEYVDALTDELINEFAMVNEFSRTSEFAMADDLPITFELSGPLELQSLAGGTRLTRTPDGSGAFSVGLTGRRRSGSTKRPALITTGHAFVRRERGTPVYNQSRRRIGYLAVARCGWWSIGNPFTSPNGDWAIIDLNELGQTMVTNMLRTGDRINHVQNNVPVGGAVNGTGIMTRLWQGTVHAINQDHAAFGITGVTTVNRRAGSAHPVNGDSGGSVFRFLRNGETVVFVGVTVGMQFRPLSPIPNRWVFSPHEWNAPFFIPRTTA